MSVINKMLRDLEQRQQSAHVPGTYQPSNDTSGAHRIARMVGYMLFAGALLVSAVIAVRWLQPSDSTPPPIKPTSVKLAQVKKVDTQTTAVEVPEPGAKSDTLAAVVPQRPSDKQPRSSQGYVKSDQQQSTPSYRHGQTRAQAQTVTPVQTQPQQLVAKPRKTDGPAEASSNPLAALQEQVAGALMMQNTAQAISLLEEYIEAHRTEAWPVLALAELFDRSGQFAVVERVYRQWLNVSTSPTLPDEVAIELRLAFADWLLRRRQLERAKTVLAEVPVGLGSYQLSEKTLAKAIRLFEAMNVKQRECQAREHWLSYQPNSARRQLGLAVCFEQVGNMAQAVQHYQRLSVGRLPPEGQEFVRQRLAALSQIGQSADGLAKQLQSEQPRAGREQ